MSTFSFVIIFFIQIESAMNHDETTLIMRAGTLRKRGTHKKDEFHSRYHQESLLPVAFLILMCTGRYVCVWATRVGYSLSPSADTICDFIDMNDIDSCVAVDPSNKNEQVKCDFMVKVKLECTSTRIPTATNRMAGVSGEKCEDVPHTTDICIEPVQTPDRGTCGSISAPKSYYFRASNLVERNQWIDTINLAITRNEEKKRKRRVIESNFFLRNQMRLRSVYTSVEFQMITAFFVGLNFLTMVRSPRSR
jgi:hypothetical protein